jgi:uncharacterized damage-inducible protein DinB
VTVSSDILLDAFSRIRDTVHRVLDGISPDELTFRADPDSNTVAWLVWHLARVQDGHLADAMDAPELWAGWVDRFGLPFDPDATGYGQSSDEVGQVQVSADLLAGYFDEVAKRTDDWVAALTDEDLERVVDTRWDPPVTLAVRLVSVLNDDTQHAGQAALLRGIASRSLRDGA